MAHAAVLGKGVAALLVAGALVLGLSGCADGSTGSALGFGEGGDGHSVSSEPVEYGQDAVIGVSLDNGSGQSIQLVSVVADDAVNLRVGSAWVAPVLEERAGDFLSFGVNRVSDAATLGREWARRRAAVGYRIPAHRKNLQALLQVSVRDPQRPARAVAVSLTYLQGGRRYTETTHETACFFTPHRASVCDLPD